MVVFPNAKINIGLNILRKRPDGFHDIHTLFYPVMGLCDILEVNKEEGWGKVGFTSSGLDVDCKADDNLCVKAYRLLSGRVDMPSVSIHLHKQIPMGAGLGGGSADGAFALEALNRLASAPLSRDELVRLASALGSDCPFFLYNRPCVAGGRGERLEPIDFSLENYYMLIVNPGIHVDTADAYRSVQPKPWSVPLYRIVADDTDSWREHLANDFEPVVFERYPHIARIKDTLYRLGAEYAAMSGSGSSVYGIFGSMPDYRDTFSEYFVHLEHPRDGG